MIANLFSTWRRPPVAQQELVQAPVYLRPALRDDFGEWRDAMDQGRDALQPWQPTWPADHLSQESYDRRIRLYDTERRRGIGFSFHIFTQATDRFVGNIRLAPVFYGAARTGTVGYWIAPPLWRRGYASAALAAICRFGFERLGLARLEAHCMPENTASARVLGKAGFVHEGRLRQFLEINGVRRDHDVFGLIASSSARMSEAPENMWLEQA